MLSDNNSVTSVLRVSLECGAVYTVFTHSDTVKHRGKISINKQVSDTG